MPPKLGWKKGPDGKYRPPTGLPQVAWGRSFVPFGDRLDFLSPEVQHLNTGRLSILPPLGVKKRTP